MLYLSNADVDSEALERNLTSIRAPELKNTAMTLAQMLHKRGLDEGRQEGRQEGRLLTLQESILDALELRFDAVPAGLVEAVRAMTDEEKLKSLLRRAIRSASIEDFAADL